MDEPQKPRAKGARAIGELAGAAGAAAFRKFGFTEQKLVTHWPDIAGEMLGRFTQPLKLAFPRGTRAGGTLVILSEGAAALELQHFAPLLIERINQVFGYQAVEKLKIVQGPVSRGSQTAKLAEPTAEEIARAAERLPPIEDARLRTALARLGAAIEKGQGSPARLGKTSD